MGKAPEGHHYCGDECETRAVRPSSNDGKRLAMKIPLYRSRSRATNKKKKITRDNMITIREDKTRKSGPFRNDN